MSTARPLAPFDPFGPLPRLQVVEASAGTGKTWNLATLVTRLVAGDGVVGPWPVDSILVVTYTRAATAELRDRIRARLQDTLRRVVAADPADDDELAIHLSKGADLDGIAHRLATAVAAFDSAPVLTIHGFCQLVLRSSGVASPTAGWELTEEAADVVAEVCQDLLAEEGILVGDVADRLSRLVTSVTVRMANPSAAVIPAADEPGAWWVRMVDRAVARVRQRHAERNELTYTALLEQAHDLLTSDLRATEAAAWVRARFPVACIDEFQDTDPLQWAVFERIYGHAATGHLVAVGDPKQAIYGFRGADVHTYLAARRTGNLATLSTNWRADHDLVQAVDDVFRPVSFGPGIGIGGSTARPGAPSRSLSPAAGPPVRLRVLTAGQELSAPQADSLVVADVVGVAAGLLRSGDVRLTTPDGGRPVRPDDLAVLVRTRAQADEVQRALQRHGIPAVRAGAGSVFATLAAHQWRLFLAALQRPSATGLARAAALGWFLGHPPHEVAGFDDESLAALQQRLADLAHLLREQGLPALLSTVRAGGLDRRILARPGGERDLTDLDHVAELLVADADATGLRGATALLNRLTALMASAEEDDDSEGTSRRVDADDRAVQVVTVHAAKGLEYGVVLVPFAWRSGSHRGPLLFHEHDRRTIDVVRRDEWPRAERAAADQRIALAAQERHDEELRLLYVALTRAKHQVVAWQVVATMRQGDVYGGPLPRVLFEAHGSGAAAGEDPIGHLRRLPGVAEGRLGVEVVAEPVPTPTPLEIPGGPGEAYGVSTLDRALDHSWRRWSFTSLAARDRAPVEHDDAGAGDEVGAADPPPPPDELARTRLPAPAVAVPLAEVPGGTRFGTLVHELLEQVDVTGPDRRRRLVEAVEATVWQPDLVPHRAALVDGLDAAVTTPLGAWSGNRSLAEIGWGQRLRELAFDLPLAGRGPVQATALGRLLADALPAHHPLRPYAEQLSSSAFAVPLRGFLTGSIDLVVQVPGPRFGVADYKTNLLHHRTDPDPLAAYHPSRLPAAMAHHHYPLQALLYLVALHRYLRWRLPGYDPQVHLGGAAYLFLRGMVGVGAPTVDGQPYGVFTWDPPGALVAAASDVLDGAHP